MTERRYRRRSSALYEAGRKKGTFDTGIEQGLRLILANPKFLFRTETAPATERRRR